jgi:sulfatase maturation enzyme AslB (radical SAM superfamily)
MNNDLHCPMIHGGLTINLKTSKKGKIGIGNCCLLETVDVDPGDIWNNSALIPLRELNNKNIWANGCNCQYIEAAGHSSYRTGTLKMFGKEKNLVGPQRLDLLFDIGCNLACRTCGPGASTFWQKHLIDNKIQSNFIITAESKVEEIISILKTLDLSRLQMVVFSGGETLLGNGYWRVAEAIAKLADPQKITLSFQSNGTQTIDKRYYDLIEKFHLVKLNLSLDGTETQFEYLRWPASWHQVTDNVFNLRETLPVNTMFLVEETISIFNLYYHNRVNSWVEENFSTNRLGDIVNHTKHLAHGIFSIDNLTKEYIDALPNDTAKLIASNWEENPENILAMLKEIEKFDSIRKQDWKSVFPEVYSFYKKFNTANI